jgi:hypothetical protein
MSTVNRINSNYTIYYDSTISQYRGVCNLCGGTDAAANATLATVIQAVIGLLGNGSIFVKNAALPAGLTYGDTILIITDYHGIRKFYSNGALVGAMGDGLNGTATITVGLTSITVNHSLGVSPPHVSLESQDNLDGRDVWVSGKSSTQFTVNISSLDPSNNHVFKWKV